MKREITPPYRGLLLAYRIALALLLVLFLLLISGSIYAVVRPAGSGPLFRISGRTGGSAAAGGASAAPGVDGDSGPINIFTGIGRLRIPVAGQAGSAAMLLAIAFPYPAEDRPFSEELASRIGDFRSVAAGYFSSLPAGQLINLDEEAAKAEILRRYNALLRLGKIETLYFNDLMIVD